MIKVNLRDKNRIVTLNTVSKISIKGRSSPNLYFHTPLELLLCSLGLCVGGTIIEYCRLNNINAAIFEEVSIYYESTNYLILIKKPEDFDQDIINRLEYNLTTCNISRELLKPILVKWENNTIPTEELVKELEPKCCGG